MEDPNVSAQAIQKGGLAALISAFLATHGWWTWLATLWGAFMVLDYLTGTASALKRGEWSSKLAREGCWHKVGEMVAVLLAIGLDLTILEVSGNIAGLSLDMGYPCLLSAVVLVWYILTEAGSILENAGELGAPIPKWLAKLIAALKGRVDDTGGGLVPEKNESE